jgi:thiamine biosynthesis lipoprotein
VRVSDDTVLLVELACDAWRRTGGRFDPTVLRAVEATGYTAGHDRQTPGAVETPRRTIAVGGCDSIVIDRRRRTVQLPVGGGFDPGGIGKGLAADLVSYELDATGVDGGCVNIGGDLRVWGSGPNGRRWRIGAGGHTFELTDAGVATSGTQRRAWHFDGEAVHHLIDPSTSRPATHGRVAATVVAGSAWRAETYATALIVTPPGAISDDVARWGVEAFVA